MKSFIEFLLLFYLTLKFVCSTYLKGSCEKYEGQACKEYLESGCFYKESFQEQSVMEQDLMTSLKAISKFSFSFFQTFSFCAFKHLNTVNLSKAGISAEYCKSVQYSQVVNWFWYRRSKFNYTAQFFI